MPLWQDTLLFLNECHCFLNSRFIRSGSIVKIIYNWFLINATNFLNLLCSYVYVCNYWSTLSTEFRIVVITYTIIFWFYILFKKVIYIFQVHILQVHISHFHSRYKYQSFYCRIECTIQQDVIIPNNNYGKITSWKLLNVALSIAISNNTYFVKKYFEIPLKNV